MKKPIALEKLWILCIVFLLLQGCSPPATPVLSDRQLVEEALAYQLPESVSDVHYWYKNISDDAIWWYKYIKFKSTREDYDRIILDLGYENYQISQSWVRSVLPGGFGIPYSLQDEVGLDWWDAEIAYDDSIAIKEYGENGDSIAKYENGYVYIVIHDFEK